MKNHITADIKFALIPDWVLDASVSDRAIRVYCILARYADNETLQAFPSRDTLARRANCNPKAITRAVDELVAIGAVIKEHRKSGEAYQSNLYTLRRVGSDLTLGRVSNDPRVGSDLTPGVGSDLTLGRVSDDPLTRTTQLEPINYNQLTNDFDCFWSIYPRRIGKQAAKASFTKAVKSVGLDTVMNGARTLAEDPNLPAEQFIPNPATWLNQGRWDDDPYPAKNVDRKPTAAERTAELIHGARAKDEQDLITKGIGAGPDFGHTLKGVDS